MYWNRVVASISATVLFALISSGSATTPLSIIAPSKTQASTACDEGYAAGSSFTGFNRYLFTFGADEDHLGTLETALGGTYIYCRLEANQLEAKALPPYVPPLVLELNRTVSELRDASEWAVVLVARDASGRELSRLFPTARYSDVATADHWTMSCPVGCIWTGQNIYTFMTFGTTFARIIAKGASIVVLARRYGVTQEFPLPVTLR